MEILFFFLILGATQVSQLGLRVGLIFFVDQYFAYWAGVLLLEPLLDARLMKSMQTLKYHVFISNLVIDHANGTTFVFLREINLIFSGEFVH